MLQNQLAVKGGRASTSRTAERRTLLYRSNPARVDSQVEDSLKNSLAAPPGAALTGVPHASASATT